MIVKCHFSFYPLRQLELSKGIEMVLDEVRKAGLHPQVGPTNTYIEGPLEVVFAALQNAYKRAVEQGEAVLSVTLTNESAELSIEDRIKPSVEAGTESASPPTPAQ